MWSSLIPPQLLDRTGERLHPSLYRLLKKFYVSVPNDLTLVDLHKMTQPWVSSRQKDLITGEPAQRWGIQPDVRWGNLSSDEFLDDFRQLGFVNALLNLQGITAFDAVIIPGGTTLPQWRRISLLIRMQELADLKFNELVFVANRKIDPRVDNASKFHYANGRPPAGCAPFRPNAELPSEVPVAEGENVEPFIMNTLWDNLEMPPAMREIHPTLVTRPEDYFAGRGRMNILVCTIMPHLFHDPMYKLLGPAHSRVVTIGSTATNGRHDLPYLADGLARYIDQVVKMTRLQLI